MSDYKGQINTLTDLLRADGSIIVNKKLARNLGVEAAIMYSEIVSKYYYFAERGQLTEDGFFFNTVEDMQKDTSLTDHKQRKAIKILSALGLIEHRNREMPQKRFFKVNFDAELINYCLESQEIQQFLNNLRINSQKIKELILKKMEGNNTNLNYLKSIILTTGIAPEKTEQPVSFNSFLKTCGQVCSEVEISIKYFLTKYEQVRQEKHMNLRPSVWADIVDSFLFVEERPGDYMDLCYSSIKGMTNHYFKKSYQEGCNYCITHFNDPGIKKVNYYEAAYYD